MAKNKGRVDLDTILVEEIGQFGKFQLRSLLLTALAVIFAGFHGEYVFTAARIETRCVISECDAENPEFSPPWLTNAIPVVEESFDNCQRFGNLTEVSGDGTCPASLFDRNVLMPCEDYVYENQLSVVYDFDLACDEWRRSLIGTIRTIGTLTALPITGYISDRWGRRVALAFNAFNSCWLGFTRYWVNTYIGFVVSQFAEAMFGSGVFSCVHVLILELVGPKYRVMGSASLTTFYALGQVAMGLLAWVVPSWRPLTLALYVPQIICVTYLWIIPESVRWYMSKGHFKKSEKILKNIARVNGKELSEKSLEYLKETVKAEEEKKKAVNKEEHSQPLLIVRVFQHKRVLLRCLLSPIWWISMTLIYHGLAINAVNMLGNPYLNYVLVSAVEIPGFWISVLLLPRFGRRPVMMGGFWICAACQFAYIFISTDMYGLSLAIYLIGKCSIATVVTALYVYTSEIYPTECRHSLFAFSSMIGRIGSITAPLTPAIGAATFDNMPFLIFGVMAFASGLLVRLTPETLNTRLPDTMQEANLLGTNNKTNTEI